MSELKVQVKKNDQIRFNKDSDQLDLGIEKNDRVKIEKIIEINNSSANETITKCEISPLQIAPHHIRDYEIKKPKEKEPSLLKMITNKLKRKQ